MLLSNKLKMPVMLIHAKHLVEDELKRLGLTHDRVNSKLVPTKDYVQNLNDVRETKRRERLTLRKLQFELLKKRQNVRDRKGKRVVRIGCGGLSGGCLWVLWVY